jgi:signal transduction histidine kinase
VGFNGVYQGIVHLAVRFPELPRESADEAQDVSAVDDLEIAFSNLRRELRHGSRIGFRLLVEGRSRELNPAVREDAYRIGREALLNAFRHSEASRVEVDIEYATTRLRIAVRDDGKGILDGLFHSERRRYRGLTAIRELAEAMGAKLRLMSRAAAGTEVELSIPGRIAFASQRNVGRWGWRMPQTEQQSAR